MYQCERCQIEAKYPMSCSYMPRRSCSTRFIGVINAPKIGEESLRRVSDDCATIKWVIKKIDSTKFGPIEKAINWNNINALEQNKVLDEIISLRQQLTIQVQELKKQVKRTRKAQRFISKQLSE